MEDINVNEFDQIHMSNNKFEITANLFQDTLSIILEILEEIKIDIILNAKTENTVNKINTLVGNIRETKRGIDSMTFEENERD